METTILDPRRKTQDARRGFTLVEMLTVVAIIAVLAGILYPALRTIREGPKKAQARTDIRKLELALQNYYSEYGKWPPTSNVGVSDGDFNAMLNGNRYPWDGTALGAYGTTYNPRGVRFMDFPKKQIDSNNRFLDPWGNPYVILMDNGQNSVGNSAVIGGNWRDYKNGDTVSSPNDGILRDRADLNYQITKPIAIYSFGPNGTNENAPGPEFDDITNWY